MTGISPREVCGVVLAGGDSTRFGDSDKALAQFAGKPLVSHVTSVLHAATGEPPILAARTDDRATMLSDVLPKLPSIPDAPESDSPKLSCYLLLK
ncbi:MULTISPECIES: molybdenum cofactor guanylyltransferase [Haloferax]|uniref:NTP transferase domain-containing protein n=2 Tax=Haloferax TaxID=2251 RepID=A0A6G1Z6G3_9EURY|nr:MULTISPECIES: NTP transferase domain-containing protein [Haloferax]KAB1185482.1 NTP transferase domain-containing protein [Haloferax sp. CBA1149]MRW82132.1 NTP transferase domain-containing protein [Haloferax marinisediminis]